MKKEIPNIDFKTEALQVGYKISKTPLLLLSDLYININAPKLIAILGKNGSGKSTLLKTLAGMHTPLSGEVYYDGKPISKISSRKLAHHISVVLTDYEATANFTVEEMVAMGRISYTDWWDHKQPNDRKLISQAIAWTQIAHIQHKKFYELSDGQKQKVMVARALAQDTPIIWLDEPTVHLDINHVMEMMLLFRRLVNERKKAIVFTTHEVSLSLKLSDEIWLIDKGKFYINNVENTLKKGLVAKVFNTNQVKFDVATKHFVYPNYE